MDYKELAPIVENAFKKGLDRAKNPTFGGPVNATMSLRNSIKVSAIKSGLEAQFNEYGYFINDGTRRSKYAGSTSGGNGNSPMITSILEWIDAKRIKPRFGTKLGLAFAIRNSVWDNGLKPNNWIDEVIDVLLDENGDTYEYLQQLAVEDIEQEIETIIEAIEGI